MSKFLKLSKTKQYLDAISRSVDNDSNLQSNDSVKSIDITNSLTKEIQSIIKKEGLTDAYNKLDVSKLPQPISFAFKVIEVTIHNFKSIKEYTLNLSEMNTVKTILISGRNGSGKSAILQAIYLGLTGYRFISRYNRIDSTGKSYPCRIELIIHYLDRYYKLIRGDGLLQFFSSSDNVTYTEIDVGNKSNLEAYINETLPFVQHLSYLHIGANEHYFNKIDRVGLIKTCFNLDILFHIYEAARNQVSALKKSIDGYKNSIVISNTLLERYIEEFNRLNEELSLCNKDLPINKLTCNPYTKDELFNLLTEVDRISSALKLTNNLINTSRARVESIDKIVKDDSNIDIAAVNYMKTLITNVNSYNDIINELSNKLSEAVHQYEMYLDRLSCIKTNITKCPNCGTEVLNDSISSKVEAINESIAEYSEKIKLIKNELSNMKVKASNYIDTLDKTYADILSIDMDSYKLIIDEKVPKLSYYEGLEVKYRNISNLESERSKLLGDIDGYNNKCIELESELAKIIQDKSMDDYRSYLNLCIGNLVNMECIEKSIASSNTSISNTKLQITEYEGKLDSLSKDLSDMSRLMKLFDQSNLDSVPYSIIEHVVNSMNTEDIKFRSFKELNNGELKFDVSCSLKLGNDFYIDYDSASDGQKLIMDLFILRKLVNLLGNIGLIIMDESLTNLDEVSYTMAKNFFRDTNCDKILIVSHNPNIDGHDTELKCRLTEDLITEVT